MRSQRVQVHERRMWCKSGKSTGTLDRLRTNLQRHHEQNTIEKNSSKIEMNRFTFRTALAGDEENCEGQNAQTSHFAVLVSVPKDHWWQRMDLVLDPSLYTGDHLSLCPAVFKTPSWHGNSVGSLLIGYISPGLAQWRDSLKTNNSRSGIHLKLAPLQILSRGWYTCHNRSHTLVQGKGETGDDGDPNGKRKKKLKGHILFWLVFRPCADLPTSSHSL